MCKKWFVYPLFALWLLVACQPQVTFVEVTRLVQASPATAEATVVTAEQVIVTRPVTVTRLVTRTMAEEVVVEATPAPLGSAQRPVQLLFAPVADTRVIKTRGQALSTALAEATDRHYEIGVLDSQQSLVDLMCAAPADTVGFLSPMAYVLAHERCNVQAGNVALGADELTWRTGMIVVRRDSGINSLPDLAGKRWAVPSSTSLPNFLYFQAFFADAGIEVAEVVPVPGDSSAMLAVYTGDVDFATATFVPPITPADEDPWQYGEDDPEVWRRLGVAPSRSPIGYVIVLAEPEFGGYRLRDARAGVLDTAPGIFNETEILTLSARIPNEGVAFGARFPLSLARTIEAVLADFAATEACETSICSTDFYGWQGVQPVDDAFYEPLRFVRQTVDLPPAELLNAGGD